MPKVKPPYLKKNKKNNIDQNKVLRILLRHTVFLFVFLLIKYPLSDEKHFG